MECVYLQEGSKFSSLTQNFEPVSLPTTDPVFYPPLQKDKREKFRAVKLPVSFPVTSTLSSLPFPQRTVLHIQSRYITLQQFTKFAEAHCSKTGLYTFSKSVVCSLS
jgi:hypothetical protein